MVRSRSDAKLYPVVVVEHEDGEAVYCWGRTNGIKAVRSCLKIHPKQQLSVQLIEMTEAEYDALDDYEGDC